MALLKQFAPPANQVDLTGNDQQNLAQHWSDNVNRWTETAILGDPWSSLFDQHRTFYYNPLTTDVVPQPISKPIAWTAFPTPFGQKVETLYSKRTWRENFAPCHVWRYLSDSLGGL